MPKPRVYVETTIPSFYHDAGVSPAVVARRDWTRRWWSTAAERFDLVTSEAVLVELVGADATRSALRLSLLDHVPLLPIVPEIADVVATYIRRKLMPADPAGDALHLAIASFHRCDFLVT